MTINKIEVSLFPSESALYPIKRPTIILEKRRILAWRVTNCFRLSTESRFHEIYSFILNLPKYTWFDLCCDFQCKAAIYVHRPDHRNLT